MTSWKTNLVMLVMVFIGMGAGVWMALDFEKNACAMPEVPPCNCTEVTIVSEAPEEEPETSYQAQLDGTETAIAYLVADAPKRRLHRQAHLRRRLARDIVDASIEFGVSPEVITMVAFKEGSFRTNMKGKVNETTMMQVHGDVRTFCRKAGMNLKHQRDQIRCGTYWLSQYYDECGGWSKAVTKYMSGKCVSKSKRTQVRVGQRMFLLSRIEEVAMEGR